jgi:hypothetical protein
MEIGLIKRGNKKHSLTAIAIPQHKLQYKSALLAFWHYTSYPASSQILIFILTGVSRVFLIDTALTSPRRSTRDDPRTTKGAYK